jgi:hypothetical protein
MDGIDRAERELRIREVIVDGVDRRDVGPAGKRPWIAWSSVEVKNAYRSVPANDMVLAMPTMAAMRPPLTMIESSDSRPVPVMTWYPRMMIHKVTSTRATMVAICMLRAIRSSPKVSILCWR